MSNDLKYVIEPLNSENSIRRSGKEIEKRSGDFIFRESEYGSVRVLYQKDNQVVAGLHFVNVGDRRVVAGIYTKEEYQRQGIMKKIFDKTESKYGELEHPEHKTEMGKKFFAFLEKKQVKEKKVKNRKLKM